MMVYGLAVFTIQETQKHSQQLQGVLRLALRRARGHKNLYSANVLDAVSGMT